MPCYESVLTSVDLRTADKQTLHDALKALGLKFTENSSGLVVQTNAGPITIKDGKAEFRNAGCQTWVNKIKQAYSLKTVERISKRFKFNIVAKGANKMVLRKY